MQASVITVTVNTSSAAAHATHARRFLAAIKNQDTDEVTMSMREGDGNFDFPNGSLTFADGSTANYVGDSQWREGESQDPKNYLY